MAEQFSSPRTARRLVPRQSATVAVYREEQQISYGVLTNLSESGACIVTDGALAAGTDLRLKLSFYQKPGLVETVARVVWSRDASEKEVGFTGMRLAGLRFTVTSTSDRARLLAVLEDREAFVTVFTPTVTEFDRLQSSLSGELDALGDRIVKSVGSDSP